MRAKDKKKLMKVIKALAVPERLETMLLLTNGPMQVKGINEKLKAEQSLMSHNYKVLLKAGLIEFKKVGKGRIYSNSTFGTKALDFVIQVVK